MGIVPEAIVAGSLIAPPSTTHGDSIVDDFNHRRRAKRSTVSGRAEQRQRRRYLRTPGRSWRSREQSAMRLLERDRTLFFGTPRTLTLIMSLVHCCLCAAILKTPPK